MKVEEQEDGKLGFFSKIVRGLGGIASDLTPEGAVAQIGKVSIAGNATPEPAKQWEPTASSIEEKSPTAQEPSSEECEEEELVITCEGAAGPQVRRCRGHGPTITHATSAKSQAKWLLSEAEAVAIAGAVSPSEVVAPPDETFVTDEAPTHNEVPSPGATEIPIPTGSTSEPRTISMANNLKESLNELMQIDGAVAVALVDGNSGMAMATAGSGPLNLEVAAAGNSEVVRSKHKVMKALNLRENIEDILISLDTQYHLIRPLAKAPEIFVYLVLSRSNANLAMARFKLASVEKELQI